MARWVSVAVLAVVLAGCGPKEVQFKITLITSGCDPLQNPFDGVQVVQLRVTGDGITTPLTAKAPADGSKALTIPQIPAGTNRVIQARGYDADPASGGKVVSMGRTVPFEVPAFYPESLTGPVEKHVFLRKVNSLTAPSSAAAPTQCQRMTAARAGHNGTVLDNGKVFIAGGFNFKTGTNEKEAKSAYELFDPDLGTFTSAGDMMTGTSSFPKAFHTTTKLNNGQVLIWGGEAYTQGANNVVAPSTVLLLYDPGSNSFPRINQRQGAANIARTQHSAALDKNGKVLIVGGLTHNLNGLVAPPEVEFYDPATNTYSIVDGVQLPRVDASVVALQGGQFIAVAGGTDGAQTSPQLKTDVAFFTWDTSSFHQQAMANPPRLADPGRRAAGVGTLKDGSQMILLGGYTDPTGVLPAATSELVSTTSATVASGPSVGSRGNICAVNLQDGSVLAIGGRTTDTAGGPSHSDDTVTRISAPATGAVTADPAPALPVRRYAHSCTLLLDGTVLVLGGINEATSGTQEVLQDAWIYQPPPVD